MIILIDTGKEFDIFMMETVNKLGIERTACFDLIKASTNDPTLLSYLMLKEKNAFPSQQNKTKQGYLLPLQLNILLETLGRTVMQEKEKASGLEMKK